MGNSKAKAVKAVGLNPNLRYAVYQEGGDSEEILPTVNK